MGHVHTMGYYSAIKGKAILAHATTGKNLEDLTLSEISQARILVQFLYMSS